MNALARLAVLDNKPQRIDGMRDFALNDHCWRVRVGYRITQHGKPITQRHSDGDNNGVPYEVVLVKAWLVSAGHDATEIPVKYIPLCDQTDYETEICQELDEELQ